MQYLSSPFTSPTFDKEAAITALNIVVSWTPMTNPAVVSGAKNTKFYLWTKGEEIILGPGLLALKGYYASVRTSIGRLLVNVNVCTTAFFLDGRVDLLMQLFQRAGPDAAEDFLTKRRIFTDYLGSKRFKIIQGFARDPETRRLLNAQEAMIRINNGSRISVAEFFKQVHRNGVDLLYPKLPLILAGTSRVDGREVPCWIPAEECRLMPGQTYGRKLSAQETTAMLGFAALPPAENARRIVAEAGRVLGLTANNQRLLDFGIRVHNKMIVVDGRRLEEPEVCYKNRTIKGTNGGWNMKGAAFKKAGSFPAWSVLTVTMPMDRARVQPTAETIAEFRKIMSLQGLKMPQCKGMCIGSPIPITCLLFIFLDDFPSLVC